MNQFKHHILMINEELENSLGCHVPMVREIGRYSLLGEGKRLRPLLFVLSSLLCGYHKEDVYRISAVFEYVHAASLLHDDVLDNADTRRRKASVRQVWGNPAAVLGGDFLYTKAAGIALGSENRELCLALNEAARRMVEGQFLELTHTQDWRLSKEEYMQIISNKTAALISVACACGGIIAGEDKEGVDQLREFGSDLGMTFQLIDDLLDYTSCEEEFGKPVGKDLMEGKITLPLIYTLSCVEKDEVERLQERFKDHKAEEADYQRILAMVRENGAIARVRTEAAEYSERAAKWLEYFPPSPVRENLKDLNAYIAKRSF